MRFSHSRGERVATVAMKSMTNADSIVALTNFFLSIENFLFAWLLVRKTPSNYFRSSLVLFFHSSGWAALLGAMVHAYFSARSSWGFKILWRWILLAIGPAIFGLWQASAAIYPEARWNQILRRLSVVQLSLYIPLVLFFLPDYLFVIANYLPAVVFLLVVLGQLGVQTKQGTAFLGVAGLLLALAGSYIQNARLAWDPVYLNHNTIYHLFLMASFALLFFCGQALKPFPRETMQ